jgi:hydrogenase 3 maturation protease
MLRMCYTLCSWGDASRGQDIRQPEKPDQNNRKIDLHLCFSILSSSCGDSLAPNKTGNCDVEKDLRNWLLSAKRIVLAGVGNPIRKDDFVGVKIVESLKGRTPKNVLLIECETVPESFTEPIVDFDPTHVLLIDAAILALEAGESRLVKPGKLASAAPWSSHMLPLKIFCDYVSRMSKAKIGLLLIQPKNTDFGEGLSPELEKSAEEISRMLLEIIRRVNVA